MEAKHLRKRHIKVLSYNIHKGFSTNNRKFVLKTIREEIRSVHPDLVLLQEVLGQHQAHSRKIADWPSEPQFEFLAHEIWPHFAYGKNAVYTSGHHGNAILSKYPISFWENIDISTNRLERRGLLHCVIDVPTFGSDEPTRLHAICVHLGLLEAERMQQIKRLSHRIRSHVPNREALVIGGDFNDWRMRVTRPLKQDLHLHEAFHALHGNHARTFPSWLPALPLDRIYFRGLEVKRAKCLTGTPWNRLSDHAALYVELLL